MQIAAQICHCCSQAEQRTGQVQFLTAMCVSSGSFTLYFSSWAVRGKNVLATKPVCAFSTAEYFAVVLLVLKFLFLLGSCCLLVV